MRFRRHALALCALAVIAARGRGDESGADVAVHHALTVRIDPGHAGISGIDRVRLAAAGPTDFTLAAGLAVTRLGVDGNDVTVPPGAGRWQLQLDDRPRHEVTIEYRGTLAGEDGEAPTIIDPSGTFLVGAGWYPNFGTGLVSYDLSVTVPPGQVAVSPGRIVHEATTSEGYQARFASEGPAEEMSLFAGPYRMTERRSGEIRVRTYFHPDVADLAPVYLEKAAGYIDLYASWIGAYPFSTFHVVSGQMPFGLGFPGLTYVGTQVLRLPFLPETSLGHEVLHSWWGNGVLVDPREGNWSEGLTTFMADYTFDERKGEESAREARLRWLREYAALPAARDQPLTAFRSRVHTASQVVGYHKAAMLFFMLRDEVGRAAFDAGLRRFWKDNRFRRATWGDVRRAFEAAAGRSLADFFAQWLERKGAPALELRSAAAQGSSGSFRIELTLAQSEPAYRLQVPIIVRTEGSPVSESLVLDAPTRSYEIEVKGRPIELCVDPEFRLFRRLDLGEVPAILRSVAFDPTAVVAIAARDEDARAAAREVAARLLEREPSFGDANAPMPGGPALIVGTTAEVGALLAGAGLSVPDAVAGKGSARAWAFRRPRGAAMVVVAAEDAAALRQIGGPLPHHGGQSFIVFDGRQAVDRGVWPAARSALCVDLEYGPAPPAAGG